MRGRTSGVMPSWSIEKGDKNPPKRMITFAEDVERVLQHYGFDTGETHAGAATVYLFKTRAGDLHAHLTVSPSGVLFFSRFEEPGRAHSLMPRQGINPHSGKWNFSLPGKRPDEDLDFLHSKLSSIVTEVPKPLIAPSRGGNLGGQPFERFDEKKVAAVDAPPRSRALVKASFPKLAAVLGKPMPSEERGDTIGRIITSTGWHLVSRSNSANQFVIYDWYRPAVVSRSKKVLDWYVESTASQEDLLVFLDWLSEKTGAEIQPAKGYSSGRRARSRKG